MTSRGDRREDIYLDDEDRQGWLTVLAEVCYRFNWVVHAYCEMSNHYHLLVETVDGNLSRGMRQLNGLNTQRFNRKHKQVGHLFHGRYKAILVQKEAHLLELARYVVLNPVRAKMVDLPEQWHWSNYDLCVRDQRAPSWFDTDWLLGQFGTNRKQARLAYAKFVLEGVRLASPLLATRHQLLLSDEAFVEKYQHQLRPEELREVSLAHRRTVVLPSQAYQQKYADFHSIELLEC
ncbi:transposase [Undibacterium sp. TC4M20W]|uniref:transposase n=1 Tax=Undibacterium sp. TC4M20W TaxID=3413052 RepID=UPI003BF1876B